MAAKGQFKIAPDKVLAAFNENGSRKATRELLGISRSAFDRAITATGAKLKRTAHNLGQLKVDPLVAEQMHTNGQSMTAIANQLNVSVHAVRRSLHSRGVETGKNWFTDEQKQESVRLYSEEKMGVPEIAKRIGRPVDCIGRHIKKCGLSRSTQEAHALVVHKISRKGIAGWWQSIKTGRWEVADSKYELARMSQLDDDESVKSWSRQTPIISYGHGKKYVPDFMITMVDGSVVMEEVKPVQLVQKELHLSGKYHAAQEYALSNGCIFRIVTQHDIGVNFIRNFVTNGLAGPGEQEKMLRKKAVDQSYRDRNRERENKRTLAAYYRKHEQEKAKRRERNRINRQQTMVAA